MPSVSHNEEWDMEPLEGDGEGAGGDGCWPISRDVGPMRRRDAKLPERSKPGGKKPFLGWYIFDAI